MELRFLSWSVVRILTVTVPYKLWRACFNVLQYLLTLATSVMCLFVFRILNQTTVLGKRGSLLHPGLLIISNHQSMMDSYLVGSVVCFPQVFWHPRLLSWHMPDRLNYYTSGVMRFLMQLWKTIPVERDAKGERRDVRAFNKACQVLRHGTIHVFPEGGRSPNQELRPFKPEVGGLTLRTRATVLPVYFNGMHGVQPYRKNPGDPPITLWRHLFGKKFEWIFDFRSGRRVTIIIGEPISTTECERLAGAGDFKTRSQALAQALMERIEDLRQQTATHTRARK